MGNRQGDNCHYYKIDLLKAELLSYGEMWSDTAHGAFRAYSSWL